ncbi:CopG family transcriptional regulator [Thermococcus sp.]|uniref:CopG family transcriptional regulator n=1 Tax=Thermococcus sp. TaxID=35749 RepID=UPI002623704B|nr:CopG family transcriptional regulator [Thermococcus sp.]
MEMEELVEVKIPKSLYDRIKERVEEAGFESVDEYVTYVLREVLANLEEEEEEVFSEEEEEKVKERLRALGYLD